MLAVIDYGAGNLRSVLHALHYLGIDDKKIMLVQKAEQLNGAEKIILPGVGAFGAGMQQLNKMDLVAPLKDAMRAGIPYLGICLGMQFLFEESDEMGTHEGFGLLPGYVRRFPSDFPLKVPHMGWNQLLPTKPSPLLEGIPEGSFAYFVHSYYCDITNSADAILTTDYGMPFTVGVQRDNIYGVQFHPEKSQKIGLQLLTNFLNL